MSETLYTLSEDALRRIVRQTLKEERTALDAAGLQRSRGMVYAKPQDGVLFRNESQETVPAYGVMKVTGYDSTNRLYTIDKPDEDIDSNMYLVNNGQSVAADGIGRGTFACTQPTRTLKAKTLEGLSGIVAPVMWAPRPGYWHLWNTFGDSYGFRFYEGTETAESFTYSYDGGTAEAAETGLFFQQPEPSELSFYENITGIRNSSGTVAQASTISGGDPYAWFYCNQSGVLKSRFRTGIEIDTDQQNNPGANGTFINLRKGYYRIQITGTVEISRHTPHGSDPDPLLPTTTFETEETNTDHIHARLGDGGPGAPYQTEFVTNGHTHEVVDETSTPQPPGATVSHTHNVDATTQIATDTVDLSDLVTGSVDQTSIPFGVVSTDARMHKHDIELYEFDPNILSHVKLSVGYTLWTVGDPFPGGMANIATYNWPIAGTSGYSQPVNVTTEIEMPEGRKMRLGIFIDEGPFTATNLHQANFVLGKLSIVRLRDSWRSD